MIIFIIATILVVVWTTVYFTEIGVFPLLVVLIALSVALGIHIIANSYTNPCEKTLPHDQKCVIVAVPENSEAAKLYKSK